MSDRCESDVMEAEVQTESVYARVKLARDRRPPVESPRAIEPPPVDAWTKLERIGIIVGIIVGIIGTMAAIMGKG